MRSICITLLFVCCLQGLAAQQYNLDYYLSLGLQNSPLLNDFTNRIRSAKFDSMRIDAAQKLQVNGRSVNYYAPVMHGWGFDEVITDGANVGAIIEVSKQFTGKSNLRSQYQSLQLQNLSTALERTVSKQDIRKNIITQYINAYGTQQQYKMNLEVLKIMKDEEKLVKKLTEQGVYKQTEYLSLLVSLNQQEVVSAQSYSECQAGLGMLNYLCGICDTAWISLPDPGLTLMELPEVSNSVFYRQYKTDSLKLATADKMIDFAYRPKLSAFVEGGYFSSLTYMPWKNFGANTGLSLNVPIYDGNQKKMQHHQIKISEQIRKYYRDFFASQYHQQIEILLRQLSANEKVSIQAEDQLTFTQTLVDANRKLLNTGDVSVTDYLLAIGNYLNAKNIIIGNRITKYRLLNELNYWSETK
jgi:outer membrane protein TolC